MGINVRDLITSLGSRVPMPRKTARSAPGVVEAQEVRITETVQAPEPVVPRPIELEVAREAVSELSNSVYNGPDEAAVKDTLNQLLKSDGGLKVQTLKLNSDGEIMAVSPPEPPTVPEKELPVQKMKVGAETIPLSSGPSPAAPAPAPASPVTPPGGAKKAPDDMISAIFGREEEEVNPLANLIAAVPDATVPDLVDQARQVLTMLEDWQKGQGSAR